MESPHFTTSLLVDQPPKAVEQAIKNVRGWWSENVEGQTDALHAVFTHRDKYLNVTFQITECNPGRIVWEVLKSHNNLLIGQMHEWDGTQVVIEWAKNKDGTAIRFTHRGLVPQMACYALCAPAWERFVQKSLKNLLLRGKGDPISTESASFTTSILVAAPVEEVYKAVCNVRGWWLNNIEGNTTRLNDEFKFYVQGRLQFHFKIIEMVPHTRIVWRVLNQSFKDTPKQEWKDSTVLFEMTPTEKGTELRFTHQGLVPPMDCYAVCQNAWTNYIQISLFNFIEKGVGVPNKW